MKPGDKVWIFHNDEILQAVYDEFCGHKFIWFPEVAEPSSIFWFADKKPHFLTREALCEHYRKIFE